jgi:hypothetical protein
MTEAPSSSKVMPLTRERDERFEAGEGGNTAGSDFGEVSADGLEFFEGADGIMPSSVMPDPMNSRLVIEAAPAILSNLLPVKLSAYWMARKSSFLSRRCG